MLFFSSSISNSLRVSLMAKKFPDSSIYETHLCRTRMSGEVAIRLREEYLHSVDKKVIHIEESLMKHAFGIRFNQAV